jgi:FkbM family methyltransferase
MEYRMNKVYSKEFSIGNLFYLHEDETNFLIHEIFTSNTYLGNFLTLNPGAVVFDIGANIGIFALYAINKCQKDVELYCFEPIPSTYSCLKKNLECYPQAHSYMQGISDVTSDTDVTFTMFGKYSVTSTYRPEDKIISNFNPLLDLNNMLAITQHTSKTQHFLLKHVPFLRSYLIKRNYKKQTKATTVQCMLTSLGGFIENNKIQNIDLIKIDVEGAEFDVVNSIKPEQFSFIRQLSIEVHDIDNRVEKICNLLKDHGYNIKSYHNPLFDLPGFNHAMVLAKK